MKDKLNKQKHQKTFSLMFETHFTRQHECLSKWLLLAQAREALLFPNVIAEYKSRYNLFIFGCPFCLGKTLHTDKRR